MKRVLAALVVAVTLVAGARAVYADDYSISNASWDMGDRAKANWDEAETKTRYKVQLYKGSKKVGSAQTVGKTEYDFTKLIADNGTGSYYFTVYSTKGGADTKIESDKESVDSDMIKVFKGNSGTSSKSSSGSTTTQSSSGSQTSPSSNWKEQYKDKTQEWIQVGEQWYYKLTPDEYAKGWQKINDVWYLFDNNEVMLRGWQQVDGNWYYLSPSGGMAKGWEFISDKWYYLNQSGELLVNTIVDGRYQVDSFGVWNNQ